MPFGSEQPHAPYLDAVVAYGFRGSGRFHVPGHKGGPGADPGLRFALGDRALALDIPQDIQGVDLGPSPTPYERAERLAADAYGAQRTWFLTNGATQGNHALCLALAPLGARVVAQRNSHASLVDGLVLSGGLPTFVAPAYDDTLGMAHGITPDDLRAVLLATPDARAVFMVSPTYYGMVADVAGCAAVAHEHGAALVVDQSWGPHFGFHPDLPSGALSLGADATVTSVHKMAGSLTQSAMLHVAAGGRVDPDTVDRMLRLLRSTSPSALLMSSLDATRRQLAVHGEALVHETLAAVQRTRDKLAAVPGIRVVGAEQVGRPGVADWDPLRIVLDVTGLGRTGYEMSEALRNAYDVQPELATQATLVLIVGIAEDPKALDRVAGDIDETAKQMMQEGTTRPVIAPPAARSQQMTVSPRDAFLGAAEVVAVDDAIGRISCESIAGYPPGIPALLPGEEITAETVAYLRELVDTGARLHGASDPRFERVNVLAHDGPPPAERATATTSRVCEFASPGPLRDRLVAAVLRGEKTATSCLRVEYAIDEEPLPAVGEHQHVVDSAGAVVATIEITAVDLVTLGAVDERVARAEGEGFADVAAWRAEHERFWREEVLPTLPPGALDGLDDDTPIVVEWFRLL